ncbi:Transcription elongation factor spt6, partial [Coemansia furcata]
EEEEDSDGLVNDPLDAPRHRRGRPAQEHTRDRIDTGARSRQAEGGGGGAAAAGLVFDSLESIDDETWMELQDIFGDGEEYAFAMEASQARPEAYERTLADVFEPAELEAKMMTQQDDDIRTTDIPERIQMRAAGQAESLRALSDDDINEEATWIIGKLHRWQTRMRELGVEAGGLFAQAEFFSERFLAGVLEVLKHMSHDFYEVPYIHRHCRELFVTGDGEEDDNVREWLSLDDLWSLYDHEQQYRGFLASRRHARNVIRRLSGDDSAGGISHADSVFASDFIASANCVEDIGDVVEWLQARYAREMRAWGLAAAANKRAVAAQADEGALGVAARMGISARQVGENIATPGRHLVEDDAELPLDVARAASAS